MRKLMTGAMRRSRHAAAQLLQPIYPELRLSDLKRRRIWARTSGSSPPTLSDIAQVEQAVAGVEGIVHLGGYSVEGPWETILQANIVGTYNLFEAARRHGVKRVVFASTNHVVGFYPRMKRIGTDVVLAARHALWPEQAVRRGRRLALCL